MKKIILLLNTLFFIGLTYKNTLSANDSSFKQGRIGFGIGAGFLNSEVKLKDQYSPLDINYYGDRQHTKKSLKVSPSVELGTTFLENYYLGVIASWNYAGAKTTSRAPVQEVTYFNHTFKVDYYTDILAKLGYKINSNILIYGLVGPSIAKWSHTSNQIKLNTQSSGSDKLKDSLKLNKTSVGLGIGAGVEYFFNTSYSLSINYNYYLHKSESTRKNMTFMHKINGWPTPFSGEASKNVRLSYSAIEVRLTASLQLW